MRGRPAAPCALRFPRSWESAGNAPPTQAAHLKQLNQARDPEAVVQLFEEGHVAVTADTLGEYIRALTRLDRLDHSRVLGLMQVRW